MVKSIDSRSTPACDAIENLREHFWPIRSHPAHRDTQISEFGRHG
ncbi:hypothetical protein Thi970DRAFT_03607 [Thiorhodovibrio frisius]|uniref:Uncharacterized protein n=1 Tax=Thiorhodovibrio frisius TaxID=631362 RepID=H8Z3K6_9GAMM|nr:hypothetical protein Thi970DRAFT_03607 [Thiorhodovibrio frisius]WPL20724.1 hypothetical protein Thiofri_00829 [Thiorhodovibrio frisius]